MFNLLLRRRKSSNPYETASVLLPTSPRSIALNRSNSAAPSDADDETTTAETSSSSDEILSNQYELDLANIERVCAHKHDNDDYLFQCEFKRLPDFSWRKRSSASDDDQNQAKNRYLDIKAFDDTRVHLRPQPQSAGDYINANFVGTKYIATQGPKAETVCDFWRMIEQYGVTSIVMLTQLVENGRAKCAQYWPTREQMSLTTHDGSRVNFVSERRHSDFTRRTFQLVYVDTASNKWVDHLVTHYHYEDWIDKDTPSMDLVSLFHLIRHVNHSYDQSSSPPSSSSPPPIVVHCSAGVGRTGTYITLDEMMRRCDAGHLKLNIFDYVATIRAFRQHLIQNYKQYAFVYTALCEYVRSGGVASVDVATWHDAVYCRLFEASGDGGDMANKSRIQVEYERFDTASLTLDAKETTERDASREEHEPVVFSIDKSLHYVISTSEDQKCDHILHLLIRHRCGLVASLGNDDNNQSSVSKQKTQIFAFFLEMNF